jgi:hypothetical protein
MIVSSTTSAHPKISVVRCPHHVNSHRERGQVTNHALYDSPDEEALHQHAIQSLANEPNRPVDEVRSIYESAYLRLKPDARITDYLPVLVARRTRDSLMHPK